MILTGFMNSQNNNQKQTMTSTNQDLKKEIQDLKKQLVESEAVEKYMMDVISKGGGYDNLLKAHYRQGKVVDGDWVDEDEEESDDEESDENCVYCEEIEPPIATSREEKEKFFKDGVVLKPMCVKCRRELEILFF